MTIHKSSLGLGMATQKIGVDRFSRFHVYLLQTNRLTDKQGLDKQKQYIDWGKM